MSTRFIAVVMAAILAAAGVLAITSARSTSGGVNETGPSPALKTALSAHASTSESDSQVFANDFRAGYIDGFNAGVLGLSYPDQSRLGTASREYLTALNQGYTDGQAQQATLRAQLCGTPSRAVYSAAPAVYGRSYAQPAARSTLGEQYYAPDTGIGSTARKAILIAGGAAAGAGVGGAFGGRKGAAIGALVGGGTGTALALTKKPSRAFNRKVSGKDVAIKALIGAGAGAGIGALAGGKRGALAGAALGGGGGALWSVMTGKKTTRRY